MKIQQKTVIEDNVIITTHIYYVNIVCVYVQSVKKPTSLRDYSTTIPSFLLWCTLSKYTTKPIRSCNALTRIFIV